VFAALRPSLTFHPLRGRPTIQVSAKGNIERAPAPEASINVFHLLPWFYTQIVRLADGLDPDLALGGPEAAIAFQAIEQKSMTAVLERRGRNDGVPITAEKKARTAKPV
jgi:hypothetical protein